MRIRPGPAPVSRSAFAGLGFPPDVIVLAVRWDLRFGLSHRDVEELLTERGSKVDHGTVYRWVQRFTPCWPRPPSLPARRRRSLVGRRDLGEGRREVVLCVPPDRPVRPGHRRLRLDTPGCQGSPPVPPAGHRHHKATPVEVVTDRAAIYPVLLEELLPAAGHRTEQYANHHIEADHGRLKSRLGPMRGLEQDRSARVIVAGTRSSRTFGEVTTNWLWRNQRSGGWPSRSTNSLW
jgi:IS6 family transposase